MGIFDEQDRLTVQMDTQRVQLISPPPEEILSLQWARTHTNLTPMASESTTTTQTSVKIKRKRAPATPAKPPTSSAADEVPQIPEATPNPKPRKQRHVLVSGVQSPHAKNPDADYIPALVLPADKDPERLPNPSVTRILSSARRSRRSVTPIPPYEPPADIFTPPREVFMSLASTKSAPKRKGSVGRQTRTRTKVKELRVNTNVRVKQEIPDDIDLLAPMPPPSPTDDPLLLSGPPESEPVSEPVRELQNRETSPTPAGEGDESAQSGGNAEDLPPSSPVASGPDGGWSDGGWSDSDDDAASKANDEEEGEGEFTGKWRMLNVRTKQDPPSSATRMRQELWGRPISPHPRALMGEDDDDDESSDTPDEPELVKITSADPRAAARAVAILKQHDYDCYTKLAKKRRASHSAVVDFAKDCRRKGVTNAGILKTADRRRRRRRSTMGVIGDKVVIPGSPVTTLPELLQQAEEEITHRANSRSASTPIREQVIHDPFMTPTSVKFASREVVTTPKRHPAGPREWSKEDWKLLDACFTDQRIKPGVSHEVLAPVDAVTLEDVVARFIGMMGGQSLVNTFGEAWSRDNILERTKALLKKQRSGSVAPPTTPMSSFSFASPWNFSVPDFTPKPGLSEEVFDKSQASDLDDSSFYGSQAGGLPPTLLAPRYSHLLEEARVINDSGPSSDHPVTQNQGPSTINQDLSSQQPDTVPAANNLGSRFRGFFSSYLPILSKSSKKTRVQEQPCLPLPPPSVLQKPRGPVDTPVRPSVPRAPHPKDLVHLNHILLKPSNIPRPKPIPKRLVELVPVPHTITPRVSVVPRPRRSSGSVKDLVKGFEQMEKSTDRSFGGIGITRNVRQGQMDLRPVWKP